MKAGDCGQSASALNALAAAASIWRNVMA